LILITLDAEEDVYRAVQAGAGGYDRGSTN
jgi:hypothetical protein